MPGAYSRVLIPGFVIWGLDHPQPCPNIRDEYLGRALMRHSLALEAYGLPLSSHSAFDFPPRVCSGSFFSSLNIFI